jgi:hypothetical protein
MSIAFPLSKVQKADVLPGRALTTKTQRHESFEMSDHPEEKFCICFLCVFVPL